MNVDNLRPTQVNKLVDTLLNQFPTWEPKNVEHVNDSKYVAKWFRNSSDRDKAITDQCVKNCIDYTYNRDFANVKNEYNNSCKIIQKMNTLSKDVIRYYKNNDFSLEDHDYYFNNLKKAVNNGLLCYQAVQNYINNNPDNMLDDDIRN